jgi:hypothetical protein
MSSPGHPPRLASWMLRRLTAGPHAEALEGDLLEAWRGGRGNGWYWRQVLVAVAASLWRLARSQGPALAVAIAASWAVMLAWFALNNSLFEVLPSYLRNHPHPYSHGSVFWIALFAGQAFVRLLMFAASGAVLVRIQRAHPLVASAALLTTASLWGFVPWKLAPVLDPPMHAIIHYLTALAGFVIGAILAAKFWRRPTLSR